MLQIAVCIDDTDMTKELLARGGQITDIEDQRWIKELGPAEEANVRKGNLVSKRRRNAIY